MGQVINGPNCLSFGAKYVSVYDALYGDRDYAMEAQFALDQVRNVGPGTPLEILDLGCGTGLHAVQLAQTGISVTGVDRSADMIAVAGARTESLPEDLRGRLDFRVGDVRTANFFHHYDAVFSLFHVMSYMTKDSDLEATIQTARRHLNAGGAFLFDFWHGPAVVREPPRLQIKAVQAGQRHIRRKTVPEWDQARCIVRVNYDIEIKNIVSGELTQEREQHVVRYFYVDELESRLAVSGFEVVRFGEWLTGIAPSDSTFGVFALARAK